MEDVLRPLGMTITHYSCLELLSQRSGLSNSELARGTFVTRQSMNVLLQALEREGYVTRPAEAPVGAAEAFAGPQNRSRMREEARAGARGPLPMSTACKWRQLTGMVTTVEPGLPAGKRLPRAMRTAVEP